MAAAFDPETYQQQLEECLALKSIYEDDFDIAFAEGLPLDTDLDPELLLEAGPPEGPVNLTVEVLVEVEVPATGVQLRLAAGRGASSQQEAASSASSAAAAAAAAEVSRLIGVAGAPTSAAAASASSSAAAEGGGAAAGEAAYEAAGDPVRAKIFRHDI